MVTVVMAVHRLIVITSYCFAFDNPGFVVTPTGQKRRHCSRCITVVCLIWLVPHEDGEVFPEANYIERIEVDRITREAINCCKYLFDWSYS